MDVISQPLTTTGEFKVSQEPTQLFYDTFDGGLDTKNRWKSPTTGGTGVAATSAYGQGSTTLSGGTTANSFSMLESFPTFQPTEPGWIYTTFRINIEFPVLTTGYRFWGLATNPLSPTIASPVTEGSGWEIGIDGKLLAVMYATTSRSVIKDLSAATGSGKQPADSNAHKYFMWFRGDQTYWAIDNLDNIVASTSTGAPGPNINNLPIKALVVSNSGTAETLVVNGLSIGDTARNNIQISDTDFPWRNAVVESDGSLRISNGAPSITQKVSAVSTGSVASLITSFNFINFDNKTIIVSCGVGNGTQPTVTDTLGNTYVLASGVQNGTAFGTYIFYASNIFAGQRNTVTVSNGGTAASIATEIYELDGLFTVSSAILDTSTTATGTSTSPSTSSIDPYTANEFAFASIGVGTAAQTITPGSGWINDSGQLNPTTPAGLFSFVAMSQYLGTGASITASATIVSEPWSVASALFRPSLLSIQGTVDGLVTNQTTAPSLVAGQSVNMQCDYQGGLFVKPYRRGQTKAQGTALHATLVATTVMAAQAAGIFADISAIVITTVPAATTDLSFTTTLSDGTASYVFNLDTGALATATADPSLFQLNFDPPLPATSAATAWTMTNSLNTVSIDVIVIAVLQKAS